jgi:hypothetical protein
MHVRHCAIAGGSRKTAMLVSVSLPLSNNIGYIDHCSMYPYHPRRSALGQRSLHCICLWRQVSRLARSSRSHRKKKKSKEERKEINTKEPKRESEQKVILPLPSCFPIGLSRFFPPVSFLSFFPLLQKQVRVGVKFWKKKRRESFHHHWSA